RLRLLAILPEGRLPQESSGHARVRGADQLPAGQVPGSSWCAVAPLRCSSQAASKAAPARLALPGEELGGCARRPTGRSLSAPRAQGAKFALREEGGNADLGDRAVGPEPPDRRKGARLACRVARRRFVKPLRCPFHRAF